MKLFTTGNQIYVVFCLLTCGYFSLAAINGWPNPLPKIQLGGDSFYFGSDDEGPNSQFGSGRSSGGTWGGGK
jgi:hypothetical protein